MSNYLAELARRTTLDAGRKSVLAAVCDAVNDASGIGWPSVTHMAHYTSLSERSVQAHLAALEADGLITREMRNGRSTVYRVCAEKFPRDTYFENKRPPPKNLHPRNLRTQPPQRLHKPPQPLHQPPQWLHPEPLRT